MSPGSERLLKESGPQERGQIFQNPGPQETRRLYSPALVQLQTSCKLVANSVAN